GRPQSAGKVREGIGDCTMKLRSALHESLTGMTMHRWIRCLLAVVFTLAAYPAFAHSEQGVAIDFAGGFLHPIFGPDHVVAMVAVGLWGTFLGMPAIWVLPV